MQQEYLGEAGGRPARDRFRKSPADAVECSIPSSHSSEPFAALMNRSRGGIVPVAMPDW
jgi:hypothetical protein